MGSCGRKFITTSDKGPMLVMSLISWIYFWGAIAFSGNKPMHSKGGETQLTVLQSLCVSLGSHVEEMETEGSRVMRSPADEEGRFV